MGTDRTTTEKGFVPGMTFRALAATIFCMVLTAIYTNHTAIVVRETWMIPESVIPVPAVLAILGLTLFLGLMAAVFRLRLLTKEEVVCVAFATLMSAPLMTQGFWLRFLGMISSPPTSQNFDYIDAFDDRLWPHGPNLLAETGAGDGGMDIRPSGAGMRDIPAELHGSAAWRMAEAESGRPEACLVLANSAPDDVSFAEFRFASDGAAGFPDFREAFLVSFLARGEGVESESTVFAEVEAEGDDSPRVLVSASPAPHRTWLHKTGFVRTGRYGVFPVEECTTNLVLRIGLRGRGEVTVADPRFFSVAPLYNIYVGRKIVDEAEWEAMPPGQRPPFAVVRPARRWSLRNLAFHLGGLVPFRQWARPLAIWGSYVLILLTALFCANVIMRRKWAESERYPMPNARIPLAISGASPEDEGPPSPFAAIWRNRWAWAGLVFAFLYGVLKGAAFFNQHFPEIGLTFNVGDYISDPVFGGMFNTEFVFSLLVCSVAVFFELNVLMSIVLGFWICRSEYFIGHAAGIDANGGYPWFDEQALGAYLGYFAIVIVLSSKYIWGVVKDAFRGRGDGTEALAPRAAVILFILCHVAVALWSGLSGSSLLGMQVMFSFLVICGFVAAKYRVECGSAFGYFAPQNVMLLIGALGGMRVFGARGMMVSLLLSGILTAAVFYLIPGMQFEMIEIGHRMRIRPRHIAYTCLVGVLGGILIGGLVFLSNGYAAGSATLRGADFYNGYDWFVARIRQPLTLATTQWLNPGAANSAPATNWGSAAMVFSGGAMAVLSLLRQYFAGFWFHPIGFLLGFTFQNFGANWGTILVACGIRWTVLKIGGAKAVRGKMMPFFIGSFIGCVLAIGLFTLVNGYAVSHGNPNFYNLLP